MPAYTRQSCRHTPDSHAAIRLPAQQADILILLLTRSVVAEPALLTASGFLKDTVPVSASAWIADPVTGLVCPWLSPGQQVFLAALRSCTGRPGPSWRALYNAAAVAFSLQGLSHGRAAVQRSEMQVQGNAAVQPSSRCCCMAALLCRMCLQCRLQAGLTDLWQPIMKFPA